MATVSDDVIQVTAEESLVCSHVPPAYCHRNFLATGIQFSQRFSIKYSHAFVESNLTLSIQGKFRYALSHEMRFKYSCKIKCTWYSLWLLTRKKSLIVVIKY